MADVVTELCMVENAAIALLEQIKVLKSKIGCARVAMPPKKPEAPVRPTNASVAGTGMVIGVETAQKAWNVLRRVYKSRNRYIKTGGLANGTYYFCQNECDPFTREFYAIIKTNTHVIVSDKPVPMFELKKFRPYQSLVDTMTKGKRNGELTNIRGITFNVAWSSPKEA